MVSEKWKKKEGKERTKIEEAVTELEDFSEYTTSDMDPDWDNHNAV